MTMLIGNKMKYGVGALAAAGLMLVGMSACKNNKISAEQPKVEVVDTAKIDSAIRAEGDMRKAEAIIDLNTEASELQKAANQCGVAANDLKNTLINMGYDLDSLENQLNQKKS